MNNYFYNSTLFRLTSPVLFGLLTYLMVLMFFDSLDMILDNFFSREVLFIIGLTLLFFEANRLIIILSSKLFPIERNLKIRIIVQSFCSFLCTLIIVSITLYYYFIYVEGFSTIQTELITFNGIYLMISIFYNLFFFSLVLVHKKNEVKVQQEQIQRENLEMELGSFKYMVNPNFLFQALEVIISELYHDKKSADDQINNLSKIYRYTLDNKHNDLISLKDELISLDPVFEIFQSKYHHNLIIEINVDKSKYGMNLIPGTLKQILEYALSESIISESLPLKISIEIKKNNQLSIQYPLNSKIVTQSITYNSLVQMFKAYGYYSDEFAEKDYFNAENGVRKFTIPLLKIEEE